MGQRVTNPLAAQADGLCSTDRKLWLEPGNVRAPVRIYCPGNIRSVRRRHPNDSIWGSGLQTRWGHRPTARVPLWLRANKFLEARIAANRIPFPTVL
jgi:hypothetical protein